MKNSLYERIHDLRERSGMTQTDLAMRMGVTRSGVNAWEMGVSKPSLDNLLALSRIFHTTTDYLLGNDNEETIVISDFTIEERNLSCDWSTTLKESTTPIPPKVVLNKYAQKKWWSIDHHFFIFINPDHVMPLPAQTRQGFPDSEPW